MAEPNSPEHPAGRAQGSKDASWKAITIPEALYARVRALAEGEGISISLKARKLLESALASLREST